MEPIFIATDGLSLNITSLNVEDATGIIRITYNILNRNRKWSNIKIKKYLKKFFWTAIKEKCRQVLGEKNGR